jgi:hypothetical protein
MKSLPFIEFPRERLLARLPAQWKAPVLGLVVSRPWTYLLCLTFAGAGASALVVNRAPTRAALLFVIMGTMLVILVTKGLVNGDRTFARWTLLFQRPVRPRAHYARALVSGYVLVAMLFLFAGIAFAVSGIIAGVALRFIAGMCLGAFLWTTALYCVGAGLSAVLRRNDSEVMVLLLLVSYAQMAVAQAVGAPPWFPHALAWLLVPIDGLYGLWQGFVTGRYDVAPEAIAQAFIYPLLCLFVADVAIKHLERLDIADIVA